MKANDLAMMQMMATIRMRKVVEDWKRKRGDLPEDVPELEIERPHDDTELHSEGGGQPLQDSGPVIR